MAKTFEVLARDLECAAWDLGNAMGRPDTTNSQVKQCVKKRDDAYDALLKWEGGEASTAGAEAIPPEPQPQQGLKTLLKDWVKETNTRLWDTDNTASYAGQGNGDIAAQMMWVLQKALVDLGELLDGVE